MHNLLNTQFLPFSGGQPSLVNGLPTISNSILARITPQVHTLMEAFFSPLDILASHPVISMTNNVTVIHVFYYSHSNINSKLDYVNVNTLNSLGELLSNILNSNVELRFVKLYYPFIEAYILAQYISKELALVKWNEVQRRLTSSILPVKSTYDANILSGISYIMGVKVSLSGRLINEPSLPRQTTKSFSLGSFKNHPESILTQGKHTAVNAKGSFTVNVIMSQRISSLSSSSSN